MFAYHISASQVLQQSVNAVQTYIISADSLEQQRGVSLEYSVVKFLLEFINKSLLDLQTQIMQFSPEEAQQAISPIQHILPDILNDNLLHKTVPAKGYQRELYLHLKNITNNLKILVQDLVLIANRPQIQEDSPEYKNFIANLALNESNKDKIIGEKNVLNLFN